VRLRWTLSRTCSDAMHFCSIGRLMRSAAEHNKNYRGVQVAQV
jgi:hypothetical protein